MTKASGVDRGRRRFLKGVALTGALAKAGGNQSAAARLLGISRDTLRYRLEKHGLSGE